MAGKLYVVATPIGNREDITERAKRVLQEADIIAAEDTRTTLNLLHMYGISNKMVSNHKFNEKHQQDYLLGELMAGKQIAVVSDAGTPCISDPGAIIVKAAAEAGIPVEGICGASAVVTAISISGFTSPSFSFYSFLPKTMKEIKERLEEVIEREVPLVVFFESPNRIKKTLSLITEMIPDADLCLCNDLTKRFERIYRGKPSEVSAEIEGNPSSEKGEYTLVINLPPVDKKASADQDTLSAEALLVDYMVKNQCSMKEAITAVTIISPYSKKELYAASLRLKDL